MLIQHLGIRDQHRHQALTPRRALRPDVHGAKELIEDGGVQLLGVAEVDIYNEAAPVSSAVASRRTVSRSSPSASMMPTAAATIDSRLSAGFAGRSRRLTGTRPEAEWLTNANSR